MTTSTTSGTVLQNFLNGKPLFEGAREISQVRGYQHDEGDYDRQYGLDKVDPDRFRTEAGYLMDICRRHGFAPGGSVLEIGCGTGRISIGLALQPDIGHLLITDPSAAFCRIVQKKLQSLSVQAGQVDFGVLQAEDAGALPPGSVSLILLRSVLHHILDVEGFLRACASVLPAGGLLICEEPYYEGYMLMGFLGQFIEDALLSEGYACSAEERERIAIFVGAMQFYCRRDINKSDSEDKHLFRPDELMEVGRGFNLELKHYPNWRITMSEQENLAARSGYFHRFFSEYVRYCMDWPPEFSAKVSQATAKYFLFFEPMERAGATVPNLFGTFVLTKR